MRILFIAPRFPSFGGKGDQVRLMWQITTLAEDGCFEISVVTQQPPASLSDYQALSRLANVRVLGTEAPLRVAWRVVTGLLRLRPVQCSLMLDSRKSVGYLESEGSYDIVVLNTIRAWSPRFRSPLILDHIDALSSNMRSMARNSRGVVRRCALLAEGVLMRRWERMAARTARLQLTICEADKRELPAHSPVVVSLSPGALKASVGKPGGRTLPDFQARDIDVAFTGTMTYAPNLDAAKRLDSSIIPALREQLPHLEAAIVGRAANTLRVSNVGVFSDVPSVDDYLLRSRIALAPVTFGSGLPTKVFEAIASGAVCIATPYVADRVPVRCLVAGSDKEFADLCALLIRDSTAWSEEAALQRKSLVSIDPSFLSEAFVELIKSCVA